jgi:hypothetical protein
MPSRAEKTIASPRKALLAKFLAKFSIFICLLLFAKLLKLFNGEWVVIYKFMLQWCLQQ